VRFLALFIIAADTYGQLVAIFLHCLQKKMVTPKG